MQFDDDVPMPALRRGYAGIRDMKIGQSFFSTARPNKIVSYYARILGRKFTCRTVVENGVKGMRVWRVS